MARIWHVDPIRATGEVKELLNGVQERLGMMPNMMKVMARSPAVLRGYLGLSVALAGGTLEAKFREQIALAVAQVNNSEYCLSRHAVIARRMGLSEAEIAASRWSSSDDAKRRAGLKFATELIVLRGRIDDERVWRVRAAGYDDVEMVELVANVALNTFANYLNQVAGTDLDFPRVSTALDHNR